MLLTGIDAPVEQVLYLDAPLSEHTRLQAIARVNRPLGEEKTYGLVVDYWGVSTKLQDALAVFSTTDVPVALTPNVDAEENLQTFYQGLRERLEEIIAEPRQERARNSARQSRFCVSKPARRVEGRAGEGSTTSGWARAASSIDGLLEQHRPMTTREDSPGTSPTTALRYPPQRPAEEDGGCDGPARRERPGGGPDAPLQGPSRRDRHPLGIVDRAAPPARRAPRPDPRAARVRQRRERALPRTALPPEGATRCDTGVARLRGGWLHVPAPVGAQQAAHVRAALVAWLRRHAAERLPERVEAWRAKAGVPAPRVVVADQRKRWGSCDHRGTIRLNWRIVQAPMRLVDYVVVHELVHLRHRGHGRDYWQAVGRVMPDYERRRDELRKCGFALAWRPVRGRPPVSDGRGTGTPEARCASQ